MIDREPPPEFARCPICGRMALSDANLENYRASVRHDEAVHQFDIPVLPVNRCGDCGEVFFTVDSDRLIARGLRRYLRLLQPEELQTRLDALGIPSADVARAVGVALAQLDEWRQGVSVQPRAIDNLLRVYFSFQQVRDALSPSP